MNRLLLAGARLLNPPDFTPTPVDILVEAGRVVALLPPGIRIDDAERVDLADKLVLPGLVNCHTHSHANLARGLCDRFTLEMALISGPWVAGARDAETIRISTLLGVLDMIENGVTAAYDLFFEFPGPTLDGVTCAAAAYAEAGFRAVIAPMVADRSVYQAIPGLADALPDDLKEAVGRFALADTTAILTVLAKVAALPADGETIAYALAPTIAMHCSTALIEGAAAIARAEGLRLHMHVAEARFQAEAARRLYGRSMVEELDARGVLSDRFAAAHGVWLDDAEIARLADRGAALAHVPVSNLRLGVGQARMRRALDLGMTLGIATDGANSADALDLFDAARAATLALRAPDEPPESWLSAREALSAATVGAAQILGLRGVTGRVEIGAAADLIALDDGTAFAPENDLAVQLVNSGAARRVADVMIAGRFVYRDRRHLTLDKPAILKAAREKAAALFAATAETRERAAPFAPYLSPFLRAYGADRVIARS